MAIIREQQTEVPSARNATDSHACAYLSKVDDEKHFIRWTAPKKVTNSCYRLRWKVWGRKLIEVASDGKQQHNESLFQSIPRKTAVFEVAFFSVSFCLSNCQLCFFFIQSQEEAFVTILTPVKKCKKNGKLLDVDKYLSFTFYNFANGFNLAHVRWPKPKLILVSTSCEQPRKALNARWHTGLRLV